jgi:hemerythrin
MFFLWKDEYSIGIDAIDLQHRLLILMINDLYAAIHENRSSEAIPEMLSRLHHYIQEHFSAEKSLMERFAYPGSGEHLTEHDDMVRKIAELDAKYANGRFGGLAELVIYLRSWLDHHICRTDKLMAQSLIAEGLQNKSL